MTASYQKLRLTFRNAEGQERELRFAIEPIPVAQRWAACLEAHLLRKTRLEKNYLFHGGSSINRGIPLLCRELNRHIATINEFYRSHPSLPYRIEQQFHPEHLSRESLNELHHHFETLIGQVWNPAPYYPAGNQAARYAILQINQICHQIEAIQRHEEAARHRRVDASLCVNLAPTERIPLEPADYEFFSTWNEWGDVYLHYAQLGKQHLDAYFDQDEVIDRNNISGLRYLSGEFDLYLCTPPDRKDHEEHMNRFQAWLGKNGFDARDRSLGIGRLVVARVEESSRPADIFSFMQEFFAFDDLLSIQLEKDSGEVSCRYPYRWSDPDYDLTQQQLL